MRYGILASLASFDANRASIDDMIELMASAKILRAEYNAQDIPVPDVLGDGIKTLGREIQRHRDDAIEARLRQLDAADAADKTQSERRADRAAERERLQRKLQPASSVPQSTEPVGSAT